MNVPVLVNRSCSDIRAVKEAVEIINHLQPYFDLKFQAVDWLQSGRTASRESVKKMIAKRHPSTPVLAVVDVNLKGGHFDCLSKGICIISTAHWEERFAPPPTKIFLVFLFACSLATLVAEMPDQQIDALMHDKLRGCIFDSSGGRREIRIGLVAAHLCAKCEGALAQWGVSDKAIDALVEILGYVRAFAIRRPRSTPSSVFIGHGRRDDWKELAEFLSGIGLHVDEFNVVEPSGRTTVERLTEMLNSACFAFLVMTAEDMHRDGRQHARENVVHEIGLFQGKLGFSKSIILKQQGVAEFSNIKGLTYIPFSSGRIASAFSKVKATLVREGILDSPSESIRQGTRRLKSAGQ